MPPENYVVRIYRRGRDGALVGVVESPGNGWQKPFQNLEELIGILASPQPRAARSKRAGTQQP